MLEGRGGEGRGDWRWNAVPYGGISEERYIITACCGVQEKQQRFGFLNSPTDLAASTTNVMRNICTFKIMYEIYPYLDLSRSKAHQMKKKQTRALQTVKWKAICIVSQQWMLPTERHQSGKHIRRVSDNSRQFLAVNDVKLIEAFSSMV